MKFFAILAFAGSLFAAALGPAGAAGATDALTDGLTDPLASLSWDDMRKTFFGSARVVFDERVRVVAPLTAEDSLNVPIGVDASAIAGVEQVLVFADANPIKEVLRFFPGYGQARLGFRVKLQQSTPVRAAALTGDGVWHVGGVWVNTAGGGCTAPSFGSSSPEWQRRLNEVSGRVWSRAPAGEGPDAARQLRLRLRIIHPMDTGLVAGIPAFFIEDLKLADEQGRLLMHIKALEPVSENPVFTIDLPSGLSAGRVQVSGRDNNGNAIETWIEP